MGSETIWRFNILIEKFELLKNALHKESLQSSEHLTNFMISFCFFPFKCCMLPFIEGLKMSFYHILVCDAVFVTFVEEQKKGKQIVGIYECRD